MKSHSDTTQLSEMNIAFQKASVEKRKYKAANSNWESSSCDDDNGDERDNSEIDEDREEVVSEKEDDEVISELDVEEGIEHCNKTGGADDNEDFVKEEEEYDVTSAIRDPYSDGLSDSRKL